MPVLMDLSVIICTRNRAESLSYTLQSLADMSRPPNLAWEVLVVDNGCTDHTPHVIQGFQARLPLMASKEQASGLSNARNRGVSVARGRYLVWTDDDVQVDRNWLVAYAEAFRQRPSAVLFGGPVVAVLEQPAAAWFAASLCELADLLAVRDFGENPIPLTEQRLPFGANYAIRREEQRRFPYDPDLGAHPGRFRLGEETKVMRAILAAGGTGFTVPAAKVRHMIPRHRQTLAYVMAYYRAQGETDALAASPLSPPTSASSGSRRVSLRLWLLCKTAMASAAFACTRPFAPPRVYVRYLKWLAYSRGYAARLSERHRPPDFGHSSRSGPLSGIR